MIFSGSIIYVDADRLDEAKSFLEKMSEVEVFTVSDDKTQIVVAIEGEDDRDLERVCGEIKKHDAVIEVAHHIFNFEDDVNDILAGDKIPSLDGFFKSARKSEAQ